MGKRLFFFFILLGMELSAQLSVDVQAGYRYTQENYSRMLDGENNTDIYMLKYQPHAHGITLNANFWWKKAAFFPLSVGLSQWNENITGTVQRGYSVYYNSFNSEYEIYYKGNSQYLQVSIGAGYNVFPSEWPVELVGMVRLNPEVLISRKTNSINIRASEWYWGTYSTSSYDYNYKDMIQFDRYTKLMVIGEVHPSVSVLISGATNFGMSFSAECGFKLQNFSRVTVLDVAQNPYSFYAQFNMGYRFQKKQRANSLMSTD